ncbi:MAG: acyl carrier protein [Gammaproteobacteria bacterium]|nr:acyl carrier protein [Gammaproteobacteria bacterium]
MTISKKNREEIIAELGNVLEENTDALVDDYLLDTNGLWDSLAFIRILTIIHKLYGDLLSPDKFSFCTTIKELFNVIEKELGGVKQN